MFFSIKVLSCWLAFLFVACAPLSSLSRVHSVSSEPVTANDISFLMPLPLGAEPTFLADLIGPETQGAFGEMVPVPVWDALPALRSGMLQQLVKREMRLVGVRFDPCFREGLNAGELPCRTQVRLVMQPIFFDTERRIVSTRDTAIHLFYRLERPSLEQLVRDLQALSVGERELFVNAPVGIHPLLEKSGYTSAFYSKFKARLLSEIGGTRLERVTFMTVAGVDLQWIFGGYEIEGGIVASEIVIPGTAAGTTRQTITSNVSYPVPMLSVIAPVARGTDNLSLFARGAELLKQPLDVQQNAAIAVHRIENPNIHNPGTMDCVSCHLSTMAKAWGVEKNLPLAKQSEHSYIMRLALQNGAQADPRASVLRMFGYFHNKAAVSERTLHEIDAILTQL